MRLYKTGHVIADTVSDLIGDLPDGEYGICYGILRHRLFNRARYWFEVDKGFHGANHYSGLYRISFRGTQPRYTASAPARPRRLTLEPWRQSDGYTLICPPTGHVCEFFGIDDVQWSFAAAKQAGANFKFRYKGAADPVEWDKISRLITFNSTLGVEALRRGIPVISDPQHSSIGSYTAAINCVDGFDRDPLFSFLDGHQFQLHERERIAWLIEYYLHTSTAYSSGMTAARQ